MRVNHESSKAQMSYERLNRRFILHLIILICVLCVLPGCSRSSDPTPSGDGVELLEIFGDVINGAAYDRATLGAELAGSYVFPDSAVIETSREAKDIEAFIRKTLAFSGHPPGPITVLDARRAMGLAYRIADDQLVMATYGEWDSKIEGGASVHLLIRIPEGISYTTQQGLSGPDSAAHSESIASFRHENYVNWYGGTKPHKDWTIVETETDKEMTAK